LECKPLRQGTRRAFPGRNLAWVELEIDGNPHYALLRLRVESGLILKGGRGKMVADGDRSVAAGRETKHFFQAHAKGLSFIGALIVFSTFVVKEGIRST
jgi:hypothetical protein